MYCTIKGYKKKGYCKNNQYEPENMKKKKRARFWGRIFSDEKYIF